MIDLQQVIDEARPMLEQFLSDIGLHQPGCPLDLRQALEPFSRWIDAQEITEEDRFYLASRLAAYICEYLIDYHDGRRVIDNGRILMRMPIQEGVFRAFDPYAVALGMATTRPSLKEFLDVLCS